MAVGLLVASLGGMALGAGRWLKSSTGLDGGRVIVLAINPVDPATIYAGTSGASLFRSRDGGGHWSPVRQGLPEGEGIRELVIAPSDPARLYIEVTNQEFYRSSDEGTHWEAIGQGLPQSIEIPAHYSLAAGPVVPAGDGPIIGTPVVDAVSADRVYIPTSLGVYRSLDAGDTWVAANEGLTDLDVRSLVTFAPTTVLAATAGGAVFRSTDGADTWEMQTGQGLPGSSLSNLVLAGPTLYVSARDEGVFRSNNFGASWAAAGNGLPDANTSALYVDPEDPRVLYARVFDSGIFRTANGGDNWSPLDSVDPIVDDIRTLAIHPQDSSLYAGHGERGVFRSSDDGQTWEASSHGLTALSIEAVAVSENSPLALYVGTLRNGAYKSTDGGYNWKRLEDLYPLSVLSFQIHPQTETTVYAAAGGTVYLSLDAGESWEQTGNNGLTPGVATLLLDPQTPANLYAEGFGGFYRSSDAGENWEPANNGLTSNVASLAVDPNTPSTLYAGTLNGLFRTRDRGDNWEAINNGLTSLNIRPIVVLPDTSSTLYAGTLGGGAFRSLDGGDNWTAINDGLTDDSVSALAVDPMTPSTLYAGTSDEAIFRSLDGGETWKPIRSGLVNRRIQSIAIHPGDSSVFFVGTDRDGFYKCAPQSLYFPLLMGDASAFTGVALANDFGGPTEFEIEARAGSGALQPYPDNPHLEILGPGKQIARLGLEFFGVDGSQPRDGWMQLRTDGARLASFFQFGEVTGSRLGRLDGSVAITELSTTLYFTRVYDGRETYPVVSGALDASTTLVVANPTPDAQMVTFRIYGSVGAPEGAQVSREVAGLGCLQETVTSLFGIESAVGDYIVVTADGGGAVGFEYIAVGDTVLGFNAWTTTAGELYSAQLAHGTAGFAVTTSLKVINTSDEGRLYTLEAVAADGTRLYREILGLGARGSSEFNVGELFGLGSVDLPATTGSIRITSEADVLLGDVMFGDPFEARFAAALPLQPTLLTQATFSQVANLDEGPISARTFTGLALYNPNLVEVTIRVTVFTEDCIETGSTEVRLGRGERLSEIVAVLVPESAGQVRGYITLRSSRPIVAQVLFGNGSLDFLSAVPPTIFY